MSAVCLFLWIVGSLHSKPSATEQCLNITFFVLLHKSPSETFQMLGEASAQAALKKMQVYKWHTHYCDNHAGFNNNQCCGKPSTSPNDKSIEGVRNVV
jgi:hypothetical protein